MFIALEAEASLPQDKRLRLSEPEVQYCTYMMDKYKDDYKVKYAFTVLKGVCLDTHM